MDKFKKKLKPIPSSLDQEEIIVQPFLKIEKILKDRATDVS
ncbi:hypothetical protein LEP1GSC074_2839 [Leptospira noguchii str. Hook]|nr:hypothetical protein LEP1GSC073_2153 [Leptospira noguchii str. Cascata]EMS86982.1 hypothetical protein LEP1GSC074_2839 [Leptospira noguchii str. Hook]